MAEPASPLLRVTYMELRAAPHLPRPRNGPEHVLHEQLTPAAYLSLYHAVGDPLRWDQRLTMPAPDLAALLSSDASSIYVLRDAVEHPLGLCEFDRTGFPDIELKNFGLIQSAQGRGLGPWLLNVALHAEWKSHPARIWLHTDTWDHPAAIPVYEHAGFHIFAIRDEPPGSL